MKKFLFILVLTLPFVAWSQISVKDEMVGNIRLITASDQSSSIYKMNERFNSPNTYLSVEDGKDFNISPAFEVQILDNNGEKLERNVLSFEVFKITSFTIGKGNKIAIKLDNDEVITLTNDGFCKSKDYGKLSNYQDNARPMYVIDDSELAKLLENKVTKLRMAIDGGTYDFEFPNNEYSLFLKEAYNKACKSKNEDPMTKGL